MMAKKGWDEFEIGAMLRTFNGKIDNIAGTQQQDRDYCENSSYTASVADWRLIKPIFNKDYCIDCQFCWVYCPDVSIISRDKKLIG
ncbi:MAG: pyruvate ferredoxin oxidoreductase delta subunit, partial [Campylobacterota bacterium]|nr:pyruvate ferredoxin oxidoreductase delta subunit [Campylobacterota bacterium]